MIARLVAPQARDVDDVEAALTAGGVAAETARALAAAISAALMVGALQAVQAMTLEYASTRKQFGREISKFQAIQHQLAVLAEETIAARMAAQAAFVGAPLAISPLRAGVAKIRAGRAAQNAAAIAHAVHGAIGVSQEYPLHHLTRALHKGRLAHGGETYWSALLGRWALSQEGDFNSLARAI
jgi:acyl-CoA dehydrogenase